MDKNTIKKLSDLCLRAEKIFGFDVKDHSRYVSLVITPLFTGDGFQAWLTINGTDYANKKIFDKFWEDNFFEYTFPEGSFEYTLQERSSNNDPDSVNDMMFNHLSEKLNLFYKQISKNKKIRELLRSTGILSPLSYDDIESLIEATKEILKD
jgi:hypothetical protein